jgi:hypothetical protein
MAASQAQMERARAILLAAAIGYYKGEIDNPITAIRPHLDELAFLLSATQEEAEVMVRADRFSRIEKRQLDGMAYLVYLDILMDLGDVGGSEILLRRAFWMKTLIAYNSRVKDLMDRRRWQQYEEVCAEYLEGARRTNSPICLLRPLVHMAHAHLMTGDLAGCERLLDEFDSLVGRAATGVGADLVPGMTAAEWAANQHREAYAVRLLLQKQQRRRR